MQLRCYSLVFQLRHFFGEQRQCCLTTRRVFPPLLWLLSKMETWPALPAGVRLLSNEELEYLQKKTPNLPKSPDDCITCEGTGQFRWYARLDDGSKEIVTFECPCRDQWIAYLYMLHCGVPLRYQRMSRFDIVSIDPDHVEEIRSYAMNSRDLVNRGISLVLRGSIGTGKTLLSNLLLKHLIAEGFDCYFTTFDEMISLFTAGWKSDEDRGWFELRAKNAKVLSIDDVGAERKGDSPKSTPLGVQVLETVFRHRVQASLPTIITTNDTSSALDFAYGSRFMSLLDEVARHMIFHGTSYRDEAKNRSDDEAKENLHRPISVGRFV